MKVGQWLGVAGLLLVFGIGFFALWRGANNRRDGNPDNWTSTDGSHGASSDSGSH
ncbi:MAG TPA: hypothetical protein VFB45_10875 [Pseudolabrys sp.]|nr:hypothetical protein [Pseudolabrys sp.]